MEIWIWWISTCKMDCGLLILSRIFCPGFCPKECFRMRWHKSEDMYSTDEQLGGILAVLSVKLSTLVPWRMNGVTQPTLLGDKLKPPSWTKSRSTSVHKISWSLDLWHYLWLIAKIKKSQRNCWLSWACHRCLREPELVGCRELSAISAKQCQSVPQIPWRNRCAKVADCSSVLHQIFRIPVPWNQVRTRMTWVDSQNFRAVSEIFVSRLSGNPTRRVPCSEKNMASLWYYIIIYDSLVIIKSGHLVRYWIKLVSHMAPSFKTTTLLPAGSGIAM